MIAFPLLFLMIAAVWLYYATKEKDQTWRASQRTTRSDKPYLWQYEAPGRKKPAVSRIGVSAAIPFIFKVEEERWSHRISKWFGFCQEFQTDDPDFDQKVYILSDDRMFQQKLHDDIGLHQLIIRAFALGAKHIYSMPGYIIIQLKVARETLPPDDADALADILYEIKRHLGTFTDASSQGIQFARQAFNALPAIIMTWAVAAFFLDLIMGYQILVWKPFLPLVAQCAGIAIAGILLAMRVVFHHSSYGHEVLMNFLRIGVLGSLLASGSLIWFVNCQYDVSAPQLHDEEVVEKHVTHSRRSTTYYVRTRDWHMAGQTVSVQVGLTLYNHLRVGDSVRLTTRSGFLNMEWIAGIEQVFR